MNFQQFLSQLFANILNVLIIPLLPVITVFLISYIKKKTTELESRVKNQQLLKYFDIFEYAISSSVAVVNQIYVDEIIKSNGFLSEVEEKKAFDLVRNNIVSIIGESGMKILNQLYKDSEAYLNNRIEYYNYYSDVIRKGVIK